MSPENGDWKESAVTWELQVYTPNNPCPLKTGIESRRFSHSKHDNVGL